MPHPDQIEHYSCPICGLPIGNDVDGIVEHECEEEEEYAKYFSGPDIDMPKSSQPEVRIALSQETLNVISSLLCGNFKTNTYEMRSKALKELDQAIRSASTQEASKTESQEKPLVCVNCGDSTGLSLRCIADGVRYHDHDYRRKSKSPSDNE